MNFLGYKLRGYVIAASSPATESLVNVKACSENGASAVILKSASSTRFGDNGTRRCHIDKTGFWAESGFDREIMPLEAAAELTKSAVKAVDIPVIASVTEITLELEKWIDSCMSLEKSHASALQLDFFYLPNMLSNSAFSEKFIRLLKEIKKHCHIPIMPKLNIGLPAEFAVYLLKEAGIEYVSLLDSIRSPAPSGAYLSGESLSVFGSFMLPVTRQYTHILSDAGFQVCAGGGVVNSEQAADLLYLGASAVQVATEVLLSGFERFGEINLEISDHLASHIPHKKIRRRVALFDESRCNGCGRCTAQAFCAVAGNLRKSNKGCEGCGLCAMLCEAIEMDCALSTENCLY